ncbi:hypothetical protein DUW70_03870 [Stenotrophomonas maltophilia]|nr:hypothetical protein DUW70_03870 [Stenotrophomonas maltophilia]
MKDGAGGFCRVEPRSTALAPSPGNARATCGVEHGSTLRRPDQPGVERGSTLQRVVRRRRLRPGPSRPRRPAPARPMPAGSAAAG